MQIINRIPMKAGFKGSCHYINKWGNKTEFYDSIPVCKTKLHNYFDFPRDSDFDFIISNKEFAESYFCEIGTIVGYTASNQLDIHCKLGIKRELVIFNLNRHIPWEKFYLGIEY